MRIVRHSVRRRRCAAAPARDIADVAVKLRRLAASLDLKRGIYEHQLLASALAAVEAAVVRGP